MLIQKTVHPSVWTDISGGADLDLNAEPPHAFELIELLLKTYDASSEDIRHNNNWDKFNAISATKESNPREILLKMNGLRLSIPERSGLRPTKELLRHRFLNLFKGFYPSTVMGLEGKSAAECAAKLHEAWAVHNFSRDNIDGEGEAYSAQGACWNCGAKDHQRHQCPKLSSKDKEKNKNKSGGNRKKKKQDAKGTDNKQAAATSDLAVGQSYVAVGGESNYIVFTPLLKLFGWSIFIMTLVFMVIVLLHF